MANRTDEEFFDIPSVTPTNPVSPWQKVNPIQNGDEAKRHQHVVGLGTSSSRFAVQNMNYGHQDINTARNDGNAFGKRDVGNSESPVPAEERLGNQTTGNTASDNLETWDPMGADYACPTFNNFKNFNILASEPPKQRQPGKLVEYADKEQVSKDVSLYVANIPIQITQEGLKNLFQGAGKVQSCCVLPSKDPSQDRKIGFVVFNSWNEASKAIECYDGFSLGGDVKLRVKVAHTKRSNNNLSAKDEEYLTNGNFKCDAGSDREPCVNGFNGSSESDVDKNSDAVPKNEGINSTKQKSGSAESPSAGNSTSSSGSSIEQHPCTRCGRLCTQRCSACKSPYCSRECQKADRENHTAVCSYGNTKKSTPVAPSTNKYPEQNDPMDEIDFGCIDISSDVTNKVQVTADRASNKEGVDSQSKDAGRAPTPPVEASKVVVQLPPTPTLASNAPLLLVTTVASGNSFWAQVVDDVFQHFYGVTQKMATLSEESLERIAEPRTGLYCLVRFSLDGFWYRSRVEQMTNDGNIEVLFVDYANKEWKQAHELYYLPPQFSELPAQARLFTLSSVTVSQNMEVATTMTTYLDGVVSGRTIDAEVVRVVPGCNPEVVLREPDAQRTINEMVAEQQIAVEANLGVQPSPHSSQHLINSFQPSHSAPTTMYPQFSGAPEGNVITPATMYPQFSGVPEGNVITPATMYPQFSVPEENVTTPASMIPQFSGSPQELVPTPQRRASCEGAFKTYVASDVPTEVLPTEKTFDIFVTDIPSPSSFWFQLPATAIEVLNHLASRLDATYNESAYAEYVPSAGELVVAKFTDDLWYRAKVDCIYNDGTLRVTFVDFGNSEDVRLHDIRRITKELVDIPKIAIKGCLIGVVSPSKAGDWSAECLDVCRRLMLDKRCTATVEGHVRGTVMLRVLGSFEHGGVQCDVNEELVTKGYAKSTDLAQGNVKQVNEASRNSVGAENTQHVATQHFEATAPIVSKSPPLLPDNVPNARQNIDVKTKPNFTSDSTVNTAKLDSYPATNQTPSHSSPTPPAAQAVDRITTTGALKNVTNPGPESPGPNPLYEKCPLKERQPRVLPHPTIPRGPFDVVVNDVISGNVLYAQMIDPTLVRQLQKCVRNVNAFCERSPRGSPRGDVTIGSLGCARFSLDNVWYRARVVAVETNAYRVRFIDFGNTEVVPTENFREPPEASFYDLAPQAVCCCLATSDGGADDKCKEMLVKLTRNKILSCTVFDAQATPYVVKLEECSGGERIDLAKKLQDYMTPRPSSQNSTSPFRGKNSRPSSQNSARPTSPSPAANSRNRSAFGELVLSPAITSAGIGGIGTELDLLATDVAHPTYFWAQVALRVNIENLNRLTADLNTHYNKTNYPPYDANVNSLCACKFSVDNTWYRGFIKGEHPTKGFIVHFVDFGNSEVTTAERLRPLKEIFLIEPFRAILCSMACIEPVEGKFWSEETIEYFKGKVNGSVLKCIVVHNSFSRLFVDVQDPGADDGQSVKTGLVDGGMAKEVGSFSFSPKKRSSVDENQTTMMGDGGQQSPAESNGGSVEQFMQRNPSQQFNQSAIVNESDGSQDLDSAAQNRIPVQPKQSAFSFDNPPTISRTTPSEPERMMACQFPFAAVDAEDHVRVMVAEVTSAREIYFQVVDADSVAALTALSESLEAQYRNTTQSYTPIPGELCCALFPVDNCWYRVVVRGVDLSAEHADVRFLDYGNQDNVGFASLRPIAPSLTKRPFQGRQAALAGVSADGAVWSQDRLAYLKSVLLEKLLMGKVSGEVQGVLEMEFYDTSGEEDILINALFTEQGYPDARPVPPHVGSPSVPVMPEETDYHRPQARAQPEPHVTNPPVAMIPDGIGYHQPQGTPQHETPLAPSPPLIPEVMPTESDLNVFVTEVYGPDCFYVQNIVPDAIQQFVAMTQQMNSFCENARGVLPSVNVGDACCSKFSFDGQWYRAKVEALLDNGLVRVFYLDFGNREDVDPSTLKPLDRTFVHCPTQGLQCTLANVQPAHGAWSSRASEWLKSSILGRQLCARVVGRVGTVLQLELIDTSNPDQDVVINFKMAEIGEGKMA